MTGQLINLFFNIVMMVLLFYAIAQFVPLRVKWWKLSLFILYLPIHFLLRDYAINIESWFLFNLLAYALMPIIIIALLLWAFSGKIWKRILIFLLFSAFYVVTERIGFIFFQIFTGHAFSFEGLDFSEPEWIYASSISMLFYITIFGISIWGSRIIKFRRFNPTFLLFPVFPIGQAILLTGLWGAEFANDNAVLIGLVFGFIANIALLIIILEQDKKSLLQDELRETRHAMELEQSHYREVEKRREELTKIRHDFNNQLAVISQLISTGEENSAQDMINTLSKEIIETKENPYCNIPVINAILIEKTKTCEDLGITLVVDLSLPTTLSVEQMHLCSIFGNLLDNAINACKQQKHTDKPTIQLSSMVDGDYLFIKAVNPSEEPPKTPMPGRGYGKRILTDLSARYGGDYRTEYNDGVFTAVVSLLAVSEV